VVNDRAGKEILVVADREKLSSHDTHGTRLNSGIDNREICGTNALVASLFTAPLFRPDDKSRRQNWIITVKQLLVSVSHEGPTTLVASQN
jgi:hypothetical protein